MNHGQKKCSFLPHLYCVFIVFIQIQAVISSHVCTLNSHDHSSYFTDDPSTVCNSIDLFGNDTARFEQYSHCRVVNGHFVARFVDLAQLPVFENLEIIRDFLILKSVRSSLSNRTLATVFPRLHSIYGEHQVRLSTVIVLDYQLDDNFQLPALKTVCGNVRLQRSSGVCFPHSKTYWNILRHQPLLVPFNASQVIHLDNRQMSNFVPVNSSHFAASLTLPIFRQNSVRQNQIRSLRIVNYQLDEQQFDLFKAFSTNSNSRDDLLRAAISTSPCYPIGWGRSFVLGNLRDTENADFLNDGGDQELELTLKKPSLVGRDAFYRTDQYNYSHYRTFLSNQYDILRINVWNEDFEGFKNYTFNDTFQFGSYYVIKTLLCSEDLIYSCKTDRIFLLKFDSEPNRVESRDQWIIGLFLLPCIVLIIGLCFFRFYAGSFCFKKRHDMVSFNPEYRSLSTGTSSSTSSIGSSEIRSRKCSEIDKNRLILKADNLLGKGQFGYVYEGQLDDFQLGSHCIIPGNEEHCEHRFQIAGHSNNFQRSILRVAIKQLKSTVSDAERERFLLEANIMRAFSAHHLVKLIGVCSIEPEPVLVVMEYMANGDLKRYLVKCQHQFNKSHEPANIPTYEAMVQWAVQIADGMHYLHSRQVIHRDLATRNCMLTSDLQIKIGDFGLTRYVLGGDYYRLTTEVSMPLRWMAPESLQKMIFSPKTDVWSFGVVLWEIMSLGKQPYRGVPDEVVKELICSHTRLSQPSHKWPFLWNLTKYCWNKQPDNRPSFETIIKILYPRLSDDAKQSFTAKSFFHELQAAELSNDLELHNTSIQSPYGIFSRVWTSVFRNVGSLHSQDVAVSNVRVEKRRKTRHRTLEAARSRQSFYQRYRNYRAFKNYPNIPFIRTSSASSKNSTDTSITILSTVADTLSPQQQQRVRKISADSVYNSAPDYSDDSPTFP